MSWLAYDHYRPWLNFHSELLAFVGLCGMLAGVLRRSGGIAVVPWTSAWIAVVALLPWIQYATGISLFAGDALLSSLYLSGLLAAVFTGYALSQPKLGQPSDGLMGLMYSLWISALISAAIGLAQWFDVQGPLGMYVVQTDIGDRARSNLGQPNQLATLLLMGVTASVYLFECRVLGRLAFYIGIAFMTGVLILTESRSGMLSVLVMAVFLVWKKRILISRLSACSVGVWVACFVTGTLALPFLSDALLRGDLRGISSAEPISQRWLMWQQIAYAVGQSPWVGFGWNQTPTAHAAGAVAFPGSVTYTNAHNFVMDLLAWNGLPLGLLLTAAIGYWFVSRMWSTSRCDGIHAMTCLLPLGVHSMLEFPFVYAYFLIAAGFMVGMAEATMMPAKTIRLKKRWAWYFMALWMSVGSYLTYEYFLIEEDFRVVRFENLRIGKTPDGYEIPNVWMISHLAAMLKAARQITEPNMSKADLENLRKVSERFSYGALRYRYAIALGLNADPVGASQQLAIVRGMYGENFYQSCKQNMRQLEKDHYPQLAAVATP
ncbi:O-antigen ligase family protein [Rhodoferax sp.]|uniref:PglL family O-oligosaccharyltransferase n=1 Tax=Rhodoferax sp. TaxID=50421 RepID=UPI0025ECE5E2|nr:O-antigen ligase family protein [Rhodoferax sp.]